MAMQHPHLPFLFLLSCLFVVVTAGSQAPLLSSSTVGANQEASIRNAPHIFNALHGAMRQWDSSLHHNGMSLFPVTVPANTLLYHGTDTVKAVKGLEWLAFEVEHAELFAQAGRLRLPGPRKNHSSHRSELIDTGNGGSNDDGEQRGKYGYLHTYRTLRPLNRLLYIDGMSAGKTTMGTLDTQSLVLLLDLNVTSSFQPFGDYQRAVALCNLTDKIEGFIRMEVGFEIILCNFEDGLELASAYQRPDKEDGGNVWPGNESLAVGEFARGISQRYHGIGNGRVGVDYSRMTSAFWYDLNLTNPDEKQPELPRLSKADAPVLEQVKEDVLGQFAHEQNTERKSLDWQGITDMIVTRYADRLAFLALNTSSATEMLSEVTFLLAHFTNYAAPNTTKALEKCAGHYLLPATPITKSDHLIQVAIVAVSKRICSTLFEIQAMLREKGEAASEPAKVMAQELMRYLDWSRWLECGKCAWDEVCYVAAWPFGSTEDHTNPGCINVRDVWKRMGYWGDLNITREATDRLFMGEVF